MQESTCGTNWDELYSKNLNSLPWIGNPYPREVFIKFLNQFPREGIVLDYGCGNGRFCRLLRSRGAKVINLDISFKALEICKKNNPNSTVLCFDSPNKMPKISLDAIFCWGVLHHIHPSKRFSFMKGFSDLLLGGGKILIGGWSDIDPEFKKGMRVSEITKGLTWNIDSFMASNAEVSGFKVIEKGLFPFFETVMCRNRIFSYYFLEKL